MKISNLPRKVRKWRLKRILILSALLLCLSLMISIPLFSHIYFISKYNQSYHDFEAQFYSEHPLTHSPSSKLIILWTSDLDTEDETFKDRTLAGCPRSECVFSTDRRFVQDASAVVFNGEHLDIHDTPIYRSLDQIYVWYNLQSPGVYDLKKRRSLTSLSEEKEAASKNFFNWTATYHNSSDLVVGPTVINKLTGVFHILFVYVQ